jgi:Mg-chelatase subunit ChlD
MFGKTSMWKRIGMGAAVVACATLAGAANAGAEDPAEEPVVVAKADEAARTPKASTSKKKAARPRLDVVFAVDATSSMADEIEVIKKEVWTIANRLMTGKPAPDIRFGLVFYKDVGDDFVVRATPLTRDVDKIHGLLMSAPVSGGGDFPEHVGRGLHAAMEMDWDTSGDVAKMVYLVGDAPASRRDDQYTVPTAIAKAKELGVVIHAIGCSGIRNGREEFTHIATETDGTYQSLTYHAVVKGDDGKERSVVYHDGETYEADEVLSDEEWKEGAGELLKKKKVKKASRRTKSRAASAPKRNNMDDVAFDSVAGEAEKMGVSY